MAAVVYSPILIIRVAFKFHIVANYKCRYPSMQYTVSRLTLHLYEKLQTNNLHNAKTARTFGRFSQNVVRLFSERSF